MDNIIITDISSRVSLGEVKYHQMNVKKNILAATILEKSLFTESFHQEGCQQ